jgi:hypothetical protein
VVCKEQANHREKKLLIALAALVIGVGTFYVYDLLLIDPANVTPKQSIQLLELVLYRVSYLCLFAVWGYVYRHGPEAFRLFAKK